MGMPPYTAGDAAAWECRPTSRRPYPHVGRQSFADVARMRAATLWRHRRNATYNVLPLPNVEEPISVTSPLRGYLKSELSGRPGLELSVGRRGSRHLSHASYGLIINRL